MTCNWQQPDWPEFRFDLDGIAAPLSAITDHAGRVAGLLEGLPGELGTEAVLDLMIAEAVMSLAIEGGVLSRDDVRSSIRNRLGLNPVPQPVDSRLADGAGELMVAVRNGFHEPLSEATLFVWHRMLLGGSTRLRSGLGMRGTAKTLPTAVSRVSRQKQTRGRPIDQQGGLLGSFRIQRLQPYPES